MQRYVKGFGMFGIWCCLMSGVFVAKMETVVGACVLGLELKLREMLELLN